MSQSEFRAVTIAFPGLCFVGGLGPTTPPHTRTFLVRASPALPDAFDVELDGYRLTVSGELVEMVMADMGYDRDHALYQLVHSHRTGAIPVRPLGENYLEAIHFRF